MPDLLSRLFPDNSPAEGDSMSVAAPIALKYTAVNNQERPPQQQPLQQPPSRIVQLFLSAITYLDTLVLTL